MQKSQDKNAKKTDNRVRNFASVVYPESAPADWQELLAGCFVPAFISPLHDKDTNPTGEPKKPHYHVILMYDGKKSDEQAREVFDLIGGVGLEHVGSIRGYSRYLCHLDNPEKAQYSPEEVRCLCGADYTAIIGLATDKYKAIKEMIQFCKDNCIISYSELLEYCSEERFDWFRVLCDCGTVVMKEYLKSVTWTHNIRTTHQTKCDPNTGEVINYENDETDSRGTRSDEATSL